MATTQMNIMQVAHDLAGALKGEWRVFPGYWGGRDAFIRSAAGEGLHVRLALDTGRLRISGERGAKNQLLDFWPYDENSVQLSHRITVNAAKSAAQVARDIERRLLPAYRTALAEARGSKTLHDARDAVTAQLAAELAEVLGGVPRGGGHVQVGAWGEDVRGEVRVMSDGVQFDLRVSRELAAGFARCVAGLARRDS